MRDSPAEAQPVSSVRVSSVVHESPSLEAENVQSFGALPALSYPPLASLQFHMRMAFTTVASSKP